jgi:hypothetical protein
MMFESIFPSPREPSSKYLSIHPAISKSRTDLPRWAGSVAVVISQVFSTAQSVSKQSVAPSSSLSTRSVQSVSAGTRCRVPYTRGTGNSGNEFARQGNRRRWRRPLPRGRTHPGDALRGALPPFPSPAVLEPTAREAQRKQDPRPKRTGLRNCPCQSPRFVLYQKLRPRLLSPRRKYRFARHPSARRESLAGHETQWIMTKLPRTTDLYHPLRHRAQL